MAVVFLTHRDPQTDVTYTYPTINGKRQGWYVGYKDGYVCERGCYSNNVRTSVVEHLDIKKNIVETIEYKDGTRNGLHSHFAYQGKLLYTADRSEFKNGKLHGLVEKFDNMRRITLSRHYVNGEMNGDSLAYENGELWCHIKYDPSLPFAPFDQIGYGNICGHGVVIYYKHT